MLEKNKILIIFISFLSFSCHTDIYFEKGITLNKESWHKDSIKKISFNIEDTSSIYEVLFYFRTNENYPFRNIYFFNNIMLPDSSFFSDTIKCYVANKEGKRLGKGVGRLKTYEIELSKGKFPYIGDYYFDFSQGMREDFLVGIQNLGIVIKKTNEKE